MPEQTQELFLTAQLSQDIFPMWLLPIRAQRGLQQYGAAMTVMCGMRSPQAVAPLMLTLVARNISILKSQEGRVLPIGPRLW